MTYHSSEINYHKTVDLTIMNRQEYFYEFLENSQIYKFLINLINNIVYFITL